VPMLAELIKATEAAICSVDALRFFRTERGFQGRFYCALQEQLDRAGLMSNGAILEMEYQKSSSHRLTQRPDIIFHIPTEHSQAPVQSNNFAVWALKRRATLAEAQDDFTKLDQMFDSLGYMFGFFVNIDATETLREYYSGLYSDRLSTVSARLTGNRIDVHWALSDAEA
jgi:hypothetical protein